MSTRYALINGCRIAYRDAGSGHAIVFLHGLGANGSSWEAQAEAFRSEWRVIRPDLRGFGDSEKPTSAGAYSIGIFASDVIALLDRLRAWPAVLVGTSLGGYIALSVALQQQRLAKLVLCHTACSRRVPAEVMAQRLAALQSGGMGDYARVAAGHALSHLAPGALRRRVEDMLAANDKAAYTQVFSGTTLDFDHCARLGSLALPTLVISSEHDQVVPYARSMELAQGIPGALLKTISGSGHLSYMEQPGAFNLALREFLS